MMYLMHFWYRFTEVLGSNYSYIYYSGYLNNAVLNSVALHSVILEKNLDIFDTIQGPTVQLEMITTG